jgi:signal transduction histidine kinase
VARSPTEPDRFVVLAVADNGRGVPKADQMRLFQKFMQVSAGEGPVQGTGLGLSIAKALVELQGGQIWFESAEGRGTIFYFTLPVFVAPAAAPAPSPAPPPAPWWKRLFGLG